jgi:hypothetical protein
MLNTHFLGTNSRINAPGAAGVVSPIALRIYLKALDNSRLSAPLTLFIYS